MNNPQPGDARWVVVIPAKDLAAAKSRLADRAGEHRPELALAMLLDTVAAAIAAPRVYRVMVVTAEDVIGPAVSALGAVVVPDTAAAGLNAACRRGIAVAIAEEPSCGVAVLVGDLPALQPGELDAVLHLASPTTVLVVADRDGDGTTLLAARTPSSLRPSFGAGSFARHCELGAVPATIAPLTGIRCDVDDAAGLAFAIQVGVGAATRDVLRHLGIDSDKEPGSAP
jgi:2-phospho-L-lactate/phosphoenolpyruvate guanylyltransferase